MKILVTGANGYLGLGIVEQLAGDGHEVIAVDVYCDERELYGVRFISEDLFSIENPYEHFGNPDVLLHLAWRDGFNHKAISHINDLHLHYNFLMNMIKGGCKQVAILGSMHEIGFHEGSINENTVANPQSLYGIAKNTLRQLMELAEKENDFILQWIRGYYIVGNTVKGASIFSKIVQAVEEGKKEFPFTTGQNQYDFLDYEEFCLQVASIVEQTEVNGTINVCSSQPTKLADRVERFIKENNYDIVLKYGVFPDRAYDSKAVWGDNKKIQQILDNKFADNGSDC